MKRRRIRIEEVINKRKFITDPRQIINQLHKRKGADKVTLAKQEREDQAKKHKEIMDILAERSDLNNDYSKAKQEFESIQKVNKQREVRKAQDYCLKMLLQQA